LLPQGSSLSGAATALEAVEMMLRHLRQIDLPALECDALRFEVLRQSCEEFINHFESLSHQLTEDYFSHATRRSR
jgi:hypothetical protein